METMRISTAGMSSTSTAGYATAISQPPARGSAVEGISQAMMQGASGISDTAIQVQTQVDTLLASFGPEMAADQQLRMILAMIILEALLSRGEDASQSRAAELGGLVAGLNTMGRQGQFTLFSATNVVQIQQQSTLVQSSYAVQTSTEGQSAGAGASGQNLDVKS